MSISITTKLGVIVLACVGAAAGLYITQHAPMCTPSWNMSGMYTYHNCLETAGEYTFVFSVLFGIAALLLIWIDAKVFRYWSIASICTYPFLLWAALHAPASTGAFLPSFDALVVPALTMLFFLVSVAAACIISIRHRRLHKHGKNR